ncbi:MAG: hypothetical protein HPY53_01290 [Brevinematales bacterium]|nr:hypothetical protein [Brevinematales bacterium]
MGKMNILIVLLMSLMFIPGWGFQFDDKWDTYVNGLKQGMQYDENTGEYSYDFVSGEGQVVNPTPVPSLSDYIPLLIDQGSLKVQDFWTADGFKKYASKNVDKLWRMLSNQMETVLSPEFVSILAGDALGYFLNEGLEAVTGIDIKGELDKNTQKFQMAYNSLIGVENGIMMGTISVFKDHEERLTGREDELLAGMNQFYDSSADFLNNLAEQGYLFDISAKISKKSAGVIMLYDMGQFLAELFNDKTYDVMVQAIDFDYKHKVINKDVYEIQKDVISKIKIIYATEFTKNIVSKFFYYSGSIDSQASHYSGLGGVEGDYGYISKTSGDMVKAVMDNFKYENIKSTVEMDKYINDNIKKKFGFILDKYKKQLYQAIREIKEAEKAKKYPAEAEKYFKSLIVQQNEESLGNLKKKLDDVANVILDINPGEISMLYAVKMKAQAFSKKIDEVLQYYKNYTYELDKVGTGQFYDEDYQNQ